MTDNPEVKIQFTVDDTKFREAAKRANAEIQAINKNLGNLTKAGAGLSEAEEARLNALVEISIARREAERAEAQALDDASQNVKAHTQELSGVIPVVDEIAESYRQYQEEIAKAADEALRLKKNSEGINQFGGVGSADYGPMQGKSAGSRIGGETFGKLGQLGGALGSQSAQQAGQAVSDIIGGAGALKSAGDAAKQLVRDAGDGAGALGGLARGISSALPSLSAGTVGIAALGVAVGGLALAGGVVALALNGVQAQAERAAQIVAAQKASVEAQSDVQQLLRQGDLDALNAERDQLALDKENAELRKAGFEASQARAQAELEGMEKIFGTWQAIGKETDLWRDMADARASISGAAESIAEVDKELATLTASLDKYSAAVADTAAIKNAQDAAARATELITEAQEETAQSAAKLQQQEDQLTASRAQAEAQIAQLEQQEKDLLAAFKLSQAQRAEDIALSRGRENEDRDIAASRAAEDLQRTEAAQAQAHGLRLAQLASARNRTLEGLEDALTEKRIDAAARVLAVQTDLAAAALAAQQKFDREELARLERFNLDKAQRDRNFKMRERQAADRNDLETLLNARTERRNQTKETQENFDLESRQRDREYEADKQAREAAAAERIKQINDELAAFTVVQQEKITLERAAFSNRIEEEKAAYEETKKRDAELRELQAKRDTEDFERRRRRADEDAQIADRRAQAALDAQIKRLDEEQSKQKGIVDALGKQIEGVRNAEETLVDKLDRRIAAARRDEQTAIDALYKRASEYRAAEGTWLEQSINRVKAAQLEAYADSINPNKNTKAPEQVGPPSSPNSPLPPPAFPFSPYLGAMAEGGIVPKGRKGLAYFEGWQDEAIIPLDKMKAGMGGKVVNITLQMEAPQVVIAEFVPRAEAIEIANAAANRYANETITVVERALIRIREGE